MKYRVSWNGLPLAVYREVAAHLCQVDGVDTELIAQQSHEFDYALSQIDSLQYSLSDNADPASYEQVQQILAYYSDRYGAWETVEPETV